jgi:transposase
MSSITQEMNFRHSLVKSFHRVGATKTAIRYKTTRQMVYFWVKRYDGDIHSLADHSHQPHSHPKQHTDEELKHIRDMRRRNPEMGLVDFWLSLRKRHAYKRNIASLYRVMRKLGMFPKSKKQTKRVNKPYQAAQYPGQKIQIDVKFVPKECCVGALSETKLYQFTAIDEYSRLRYLEIFDERSSYSATQFLVHCTEFFKFNIECVQTDNGCEFTNRLRSDRPTLFEETLHHLRIRYHPIRPAMPRHNGKVERSHREDQRRFYAKTTFYSLKDARLQLKVHLIRSNHRPMRPLAYLSPLQVLANFSATV